VQSVPPPGRAEPEPLAAFAVAGSVIVNRTASSRFRQCVCPGSVRQPVRFR
jgi:spore germination cell wall hydrolase CwlJ-like protein